ncbi:hypothetical protein D9M68_717760 [compost metagenome]
MANTAVEVSAQAYFATKCVLVLLPLMVTTFGVSSGLMINGVVLNAADAYKLFEASM